MGIRFKRQGGGTSSAAAAKAPTSLGYGEPAVDSAGRIYVGSGTGEVVSRVTTADSCASASYAADATHASTADNAARSAFDMPLYRAQFLVSNWTETDSGYTQTSVCSPVDGGPALTRDVRPSPPMTEATGVKETDEMLQETLSIINTGISTPDDGQMTVKVWEKPETDITLYYYAR